MIEALRSAGVDPLLLFGAAILIVAALTLRNSRRSARLAGYCAEYLRKEQERLLALLHVERRMLREEIEQEWEQHLLELRRRGERLGRELSLARQEQERLVRELRRERAKHLEARQESAKYVEAKHRAQREREGRERERRARVETEGTIEHLQREIQKLWEVHRRGVPPLVPAGLPEKRVEEYPEPSVQEPPQSARRSPRAAGETPPPGPTRAVPKPTWATAPWDKKLGRAVWHPHPDDGGGGGGSVPAGRAHCGDPVEMYRKHYDKYLENYHGYVELAEELYRARKNGAVADGPVGEREWEERLRRVRDGIDRTTARLDILEQHNPELVTDARISHRAGVARRHAQLGQ